MATYAEQIAAIDAAIYAINVGGGAQTITTQDGRSITFSSVDKLLEARAAYTSLAAKASGTRFTRGIPK